LDLDEEGVLVAGLLLELDDVSIDMIYILIL